MKNKFLLILLSALLCFTTLTGCQSGGEESKSTEPTGYVISDVGYESINYVNENHLLVQQDDKYGVITLDGTVVLDFEWDTYGRFADGYFALGQKNGENSVHGVLFNPECEEVFNNDMYPNTYIASYNDGIIEIKSYLENENGGYNSFYGTIEEETHQITIICTPNPYLVEGYRNSSACNNGKIMIQDYSYFDTEEGGFTNYYDIETNEYVNGPTWFAPFPYAISDEGYINGLEFDPVTGKSNCMKVYNFEEQQFYNLPTDVVATDNFEYVPNVSVTVADGGYMKVYKDVEGAMAIYSLKEQKYLSDFIYSYVSLEDFRENSYAVICNADETQASYLKSDYTEIGTWYEDTSGFNNGYAIVKENGKMHFVNENFETVFEEFEGESSYTLDDVKHAFAIKRGELYYLVQLQ